MTMKPEIPILYEDNHLLAVVKPPGIPSQGDDSGDPDMLTLLREDLKRRYNKPGNVYLGLVHRLDRPAGGAMLFAKTSKAASRLSDAVRTRAFGKSYIVVVHGSPKPASARLTHYLLKDAARNRVTALPGPAPGAKEAVLTYRTAGQANGLTLVAVTLHTGRPHQIRAQMAAIGCPLAGDVKYGGSKPEDGRTIALWSAMVAVAHPVTKQWMTFRSLPPAHAAPWRLWPEEQLAAAAAMAETEAAE